MLVKRGEVWLANLNPTQGSEQAGVRPVLIFQNDLINKYTTTILAMPFTTNLRRAMLPSCVQISQGEGRLISDSVVLCHQLRAIDKTRLKKRLGEIDRKPLAAVESCVMFTMGIVLTSDESESGEHHEESSEENTDN
jgi:mRNA interferase MazF